MQRSFWSGSCYLLAIAAVCTQQVVAAPMFFSSRVGFEVAVGTLSGFESFEATFAPAASVDFGDFTLTETDSLAFLQEINQSAPSGAVTDGTKAAGWNGGGGATAFATLSFDSPINALGLDVYGTASLATGDMGRVNVAGDIPLQQLTYQQSGSQFFGVYDPDGNFDEFTFQSIPPDVRPVYLDAVSFGIAMPIPEPSSSALLALVLIGAAVGACRRT